MIPKNMIYPGYEPCKGTDNIHQQRCCYLASPIKGEMEPTATHMNGKTGGFDAYFVPTVADHTYTGKAGEAYPTRTGQADLSKEQWVEPMLKGPVSVAGYTITKLDAADTEHVRVTEMVRDFGFLPSNRAIRYATSIGLDWDGFGIEQVGETDEYPVVDIEGLPMGVKRERRTIGDIAGWRQRRGPYRDSIPHAALSQWMKVPMPRYTKKARAPRPATA